jgi:hypothetical protein
MLWGESFISFMRVRWDWVVDTSTSFGIDSNHWCLQGNILPIGHLRDRRLVFVSRSAYSFSFIQQYSRCLQDSSHSVRAVDFAAAFPAGLKTAASFNSSARSLHGPRICRRKRKHGSWTHHEHGSRLGRAEGGGIWEVVGADPSLAGEASYVTILSMQQGGVVACAKHLVAK